MKKIKTPPKYQTLGGYSILEQIGKGAFGFVFKVKNKADDKIYAMKIQRKNTKSPLDLEKEFMEKLNNSNFFPKLYDFGEVGDDQYLVMDLLGPSLDRVKNKSKDKVFSPSTAIRIGIETLRTLQEFHNKGFLHRDIKPSNYLLRPSRAYPVTLIDYGLSKPFINVETGEILPAKHFAGFVGTMKYASINAHEGRDLGWCDDIYSWYISLIELLIGKTPWKGVQNNQIMAQIKKTTDFNTILCMYPYPLTKIYYYIMTLKREDKPNYNMIIAMLMEALEEVGGSYNDTFDWENFSERRLRKLSKVNFLPPEDSYAILPTDLPSTNIDVPIYAPIFKPARANSLSPNSLLSFKLLSKTTTSLIPERDESDSLSFSSEGYYSSSGSSFYSGDRSSLSSSLSSYSLSSSQSDGSKKGTGGGPAGGGPSSAFEPSKCLSPSDASPPIKTGSPRKVIFMPSPKNIQSDTPPPSLLVPDSPQETPQLSPQMPPPHARPRVQGSCSPPPSPNAKHFRTPKRHHHARILARLQPRRARALWNNSVNMGAGVVDAGRFDWRAFGSPKNGGGSLSNSSPKSGDKGGIDLNGVPKKVKESKSAMLPEFLLEQLKDGPTETTSDPELSNYASGALSSSDSESEKRNENGSLQVLSAGAKPVSFGLPTPHYGDADETGVAEVTAQDVTAVAGSKARESNEYSEISELTSDTETELSLSSTTDEKKEHIEKEEIEADKDKNEGGNSAESKKYNKEIGIDLDKDNQNIEQNTDINANKDKYIEKDKNTEDDKDIEKVKEIEKDKNIENDKDIEKNIDKDIEKDKEKKEIDKADSRPVNTQAQKQHPKEPEKNAKEEDAKTEGGCCSIA